MSKKRSVHIDGLVKDLSWIAANSAGKDAWTRSVASDARLTINRLRKQLADDKRNYPRRHVRKSLSKEA